MSALCGPRLRFVNSLYDYCSLPRRYAVAGSRCVVVYKAKLAEQAQRYDTMVKEMTKARPVSKLWSP